jgi:hypothetical protein
MRFFLRLSTAEKRLSHVGENPNNERVQAGVDRARAKGIQLGRPGVGFLLTFKLTKF